MTRQIQFANNAVSNLASNISSTVTTISLTPGEGAKFPVLSGSKWFMGTLVKTDGTIEIVKVTARSTDTLTVVRAAEPVGGVSTAYAFAAGDRFEARMTAGGLTGELDRIDAAAITAALNKSANYTILPADVTTLIRTTTTSGTITLTLPEISTLTEDFDIMIAKVTGDTNPVNIVRAGTTDLINGSTSYALNNQFQTTWLVADRSTNTWTAFASGTGGINIVADAGTGAGSATLTLSGDPGTKNNTAFFVGGVYQQKSTYSLSGTTLTAGGAITSGVAWEVVWSQPMAIGTPSDGTVSPTKLSTGGPTWDTSGNLKPVGSLQEIKTAISASAINLSTGNYFSKTISGATTFTVSNVPTSGTAISFILDLTNGGAGTITWWSGVKWAGGTAPTLTASGRDVLGFFTHDGGTTWSGLVLGKDVK